MIPFKSCHDQVIHHGTRLWGPITLKDTFPLSIKFSLASKATMLGTRYWEHMSLWGTFYIETITSEISCSEQSVGIQDSSWKLVFFQSVV